MNKCVFVFLFLFVLFRKGRPVEGVIERQPMYLDEDFKSFTYFFASSPSASFLSRIVHNNDSSFVQLKATSVWNNTIDKAAAINQVSNGIMRTFLSLLLFALLPYFLYLGIYGNTKNNLPLCLASIWGYFGLLIGFYLTNGVLNIGLVCSLSLIFGLSVFYLAHSDFTTKSLYRVTRYICAFVIAKILYDIGTNVKGEFSNNLDYGITGSLYIDFIKGNSYFILKLLHLCFLTLVAYLIVKIFPRLFAGESIVSPFSIKFDKAIVSFLCALPVAAGFTQIYFLWTNGLNPIDPSIFFMIPNSINFMSLHTMVALIVWVLTAGHLYYFSSEVEADFNHLLNKIPMKVKELL